MAGEGGHSKFQNVSELLQNAKEEFSKQFHCQPTHAACAPGRVNLIGEHTDYNDGFVFPMVRKKMQVRSTRSPATVPLPGAGLGS